MKLKILHHKLFMRHNLRYSKEIYLFKHEQILCVIDCCLVGWIKC